LHLPCPPYVPHYERISAAVESSSFSTNLSLRGTSTRHRLPSLPSTSAIQPRTSRDTLHALGVERPSELPTAMRANHFTSHLPNNISKKALAVPDADITDFLGLGLAYSEWPAEIQKRGHLWSPSLQNTIIKREWEFFRSEILRLKSEPEIKSHSTRLKSNSLPSILKRLQGEPWMQGHPDEREERLRANRLLGKDARYVLGPDILLPRQQRLIL
jgi:hypothetical protein